MAKTKNKAAVEKAPPVETNATATPWSDEDPRFWQCALALLLVGIALRQINLANAVYSSDEAIHAWFGNGFQTYTYDPIYHGPLMYHLIAAVFSIIKPGAAGDYAARLVPSLLGIATLALIIGPARKYLGPKGALWSLALVAISPVIVAYHRFLIHDALVMLLTLGAVLCFQRALETQSFTQSGRQARVAVAALLTLFIATKANAFFIIAMLGCFWVMVLWRRRMTPPRLPAWLGAWLPLALFVVAAFASHLALRDPEFKTYSEALQKQGVQGLPLSFLSFLHSERTYKIVSVLCVAALGLWLLCAPRVAAVEAPGDDELKTRPRFDLKTPLLAGWVSVFLFAYLFGHGVFWWKVPVAVMKQPDLWRQRTGNSLQAIKLAATKQFPFSIPEGKDWTATRLVVGESKNAPSQSLAEVNRLPLGEDWDAATMAIPRMLSYWGGQQAKPRLPGPHDYYLVLMILYELPIVLAAIGGIVHASRQRTPFGDLLLWWAFTSFVLYSIANEKVPWLLTHVMFPLALLAGLWLASKSWAWQGRAKAGYALCALGAIFLFRNILATSFGRPGDQHEPLYYAQSTEDFGDKFQAAMLSTLRQDGDIWVDSAVQWPVVWYLRDGSPLRGSANVAFDAAMPLVPVRSAVMSVESWQKYAPQLQGWQAQRVDYFIWPRASWPALRPRVWWNFWAHRAVNPEYKAKNYRQTLPDGSIDDDSVLASPGEWSHSEAVIAIRQK